MLYRCRGARKKKYADSLSGLWGHKMRNWPWSERKAFGSLFLEGCVGSSVLKELTDSLDFSSNQLTPVLPMVKAQEGRDVT